MAWQEHVDVVRGGKDSVTRWRKANPGGILELQGHDFSGVSLVGLDLRGAQLAGARLLGVNLCSANLDDADLRGAVLTNARMSQVRAVRAVFEDAKLDGADLTRSSLHGARFDGAIMIRALLVGARCEGGSFQKAVLQYVDFRGAAMKACDFRGANMRGSRGDTQTNLAGALVDGAAVDRWFLVTMNEFGGLGKGHLMAMDIKDDATELRLRYSGIAFWLNLASGCIFFLPYCWFLCVRWASSKVVAGVDSAAEGVSIAVVLARYITSGGEHWRTSEYHVNWLTVCAFVVMLVYNAARLVVIREVKRLEHYEETTGLPARFRRDRPALGWLMPSFTWEHMLWCMKWGFRVSLGALVVHTVHFLMLPVPV